MYPLLAGLPNVGSLVESTIVILVVPSNDTELIVLGVVSLVADNTFLVESAVLSTLPNPTIVDVIPDTVPVNVGDARGAFNPKAVFKSVWLDRVPEIVPHEVAPVIGIHDLVPLVVEDNIYPLVLGRPNEGSDPVITDVMPLTNPVNVGEDNGAFNANAVFNVDESIKLESLAISDVLVGIGN
jgi:hypothetical protein